MDLKIKKETRREQQTASRRITSQSTGNCSNGSPKIAGRKGINGTQRKITAGSVSDGKGEVGTRAVDEKKAKQGERK